MQMQEQGQARTVEIYVAALAAANSRHSNLATALIFITAASFKEACEIADTHSRLVLFEADQGWQGHQMSIRRLDDFGKDVIGTQR